MKPEVTPAPEELAFRVIEQAAPLGDHPKDPFYLVVTANSAWETLTSDVPSQALEALKKAAQSEQELYLLAFAGVRGTSGYALSIAAIRLEGTRCTVVIAETKPTQDDIVEPAMTLPYVVAALPYGELPRGEHLTFLFANPQGTVLSRQDIQIP
jgi:hypothetical protein